MAHDTIASKNGPGGAKQSSCMRDIFLHCNGLVGCSDVEVARMEEMVLDR